MKEKKIEVFSLLIFTGLLISINFSVISDDIILSEKDLKRYQVIESEDGLSEINEVKEDGQIFSRKISVDILKNNKNVWDVKILIPIKKKLNKGDRLKLVFYAKGKAEVSPAKLKVEFLLPHAFIKRYNLKDQFEKYTIDFTLNKEYQDRSKVRLEFVVGHKKQKIEIGGLLLVRTSQGSSNSVNSEKNIEMPKIKKDEKN